jgi:hypothetical protein
MNFIGSHSLPPLWFAVSVLHIQHGRGESRSNEVKALYVLATWEGFAMVLLSTSGDGAKLGCVDEGLHEGILLTG